MDELKPCPFCGGNDVSVYAFNCIPDAHVVCNNCKCQTECYNANPMDDTQEREKLSAEMAIAAWNRRAQHELGDPKTNADRIRAMTDQELARLLFEFVELPLDCDYLSWLQQPAKEG